MFVNGYCRIENWPEGAANDLEGMLCGESPEWQGPAWTQITGSEYWDIDRGKNWIEIATDSSNDEPFDVDTLILCAQSVMRHYGIDGVIRADTWGSPEGGENLGDGQSTYISRYGSVHINPATLPPDRLDAVRKGIDEWKSGLDLMESPEKREIMLGKDANIWAHEKNGTVHLGSLDSFREIPRGEIRPLDVALNGGAHEIVANVADFFPDAKDIVPRSLPHEKCHEILEAAESFGLLRKKAKPAPK